MATYQELMNGWTKRADRPGELMSNGHNMGDIYDDPTGRSWVLSQNYGQGRMVGGGSEMEGQWEDGGLEGYSLTQLQRTNGNSIYNFDASGNATNMGQFRNDYSDGGIFGNVMGFINDTSGFWGPALAMYGAANFLSGGAMGGGGGGSTAAGPGDAGWGMDLGQGTGGFDLAPGVGDAGWGSDLGADLGTGTTSPVSSGSVTSNPLPPQQQPFNPAVDSQSANVDIANGGGNPLEGYVNPSSPISPAVPTGTGLPGATAAPGGGTGTGLPSVPGVPPIPGGGGSGQPGGGGGGIGGMGLNDILNLIGGLYDQQQQSQASDKILNYVTAAQQKIDNIYAPNSPYQKHMWDSMSAKDAAAGRNSQYGPRTQDFMGKYANDYAGHSAQTTNTLAGMFQNGTNQGANAGNGILGAIGGMTGGSGSGSSGGGLPNIIQNLSSYFTNNGGGGSGGGNNWQWNSNWQNYLGNNNGGGDQPYG